MDKKIFDDVAWEVLTILDRMDRENLTALELRQRRWEIMTSETWTADHPPDDFDQFLREKVEVAILSLLNIRLFEIGEDDSDCFF